MLGLRLVKHMVNFDGPTTWPLDFGNAAGSPESLLALLPAKKVGPGAARAAEVMLRIPAAATWFWLHRLLASGAAMEPRQRRFGESAVAFRGPDGLRRLLGCLPGIEAEPAWATEETRPNMPSPGCTAPRCCCAMQGRRRRS